MIETAGFKPNDSNGRFQTDPPPTLLYLITFAAVLLGIWGRFKGLGTWPLNSDEYYIARSVEDILRTGLPAFDCGGFYDRGLLFQYFAAALQLGGMSAELSARLIAALASVVALPAVYLIGTRVHSRTVGLIAVAVMALSAWEVDIARFGRMYAPFQAIFAWYLLYFIRYTVDGDARAAWRMVLLSIVGVFTWEGGVLLTLTNLLAPFVRNPEGRLTARDLRYLFLGIALVAAAYAFAVVIDFRRIGTEALPPGFFDADPDSLKVAGSNFPWSAIFSPVWIAACLAIAIIAIGSLRWIWALRARWPAALGLTVALVATIAHQFGATIFVLAILLLARMLSWREFLTREAAPFLGTVVVSAVAWTAFAMFHPHWLESIEVPWTGSSANLLTLAYEFMRFPDFLGVVALAWARSAPALGAALFIGIASASLRSVMRDSRGPSAEQVVLLILVSLLAVASMAHPPRYETRYVFFLFPAAIVAAIAAIAHAVYPRVHSRSVAAVTTAALVAIGFALTGDFRPHRLVSIDSPAENFSLGLRQGDKSNILRRSDARGAAEWLSLHANHSNTFVINGFPGVDYYYAAFDFAYIDRENQRFKAYACQRGTVERWGNLPLLSSVDALNSHISGSERGLIVIDTVQLPGLKKGLASLQPRLVWHSIDGHISILAFESVRNPAPSAPSTD